MAVGQVSIETFGHFEYFILDVNHRNSCIKLFSNIYVVVVVTVWQLDLQQLMRSVPITT